MRGYFKKHFKHQLAREKVQRLKRSANKKTKAAWGVVEEYSVR